MKLLALLWVLLPTVSGCSSGDDPQARRVVIDSAGIEVVRIESAEGEGMPVQNVSNLPATAIGVESGSVPHELSNVVGAVLLSDGTVVVANAGTRELRFFSSDGSFVRATGRTGEGPGEFRALSSVWRLGGDTLALYDSRLRRLNILGPSGVYVRSYRIEGAALPSLTGFIDHETVIGLQITGGDDDRLGVYTAPMEIGKVRLQDGVFHAVNSLESSEESRVQYRGRVTRAFRAFGRTADVAVSHQGIYVLSPQEPDGIRLYDASGTLLRILRFEVAPRPVTEDLVSRWVDSWVRRFGSGSAELEEWWRYGFANTPVPSHVPAFRSLEIDAAGNVCLERYPLDWESESEYSCYTPEGEHVRTLRLPAGVVRRGPHPQSDPPLEIGHTYVLGVWEGSSGVEQVRKYDIASVASSSHN